MRPTALACLALALLAAPIVAHASPETDKAEARHEFDAGVEADKHKDYATALDHYLRANDLLEHPFTIFNIATDYERLGKLREAGVWYRRYLDKATDPNDLARVRQQLADLEARPASLTIRSVPGGARAFVDDAPVGVTPVTVPVKGGSHRVAVEHAGQRTERDVRLTFGEPQDLNIPLGAQPATLLVFGSPAGATIYVDGAPSGTLPSAQVPVTEGAHQVRVSSVGYQTLDETTQAIGGGVTKVPVSLQRGSDGSVGGGTTGILVGYYFALGGGASLGSSTGGEARVEFGVTASHYELGLGVFKTSGGGDTELVDIGGRYAFFPGARITPFIGAAYIIAPAGFSASAGVRIDLLRGPAGALSLLAQGGLAYYTPTATIDENTGNSNNPSVALTFPITLSIEGVFGKRIPTATLTPTPGGPTTPAPVTVQGAP